MANPPTKLIALDAAAELVRDGDQIVMSGKMDWQPMAMLRSLVRRGARDLRVVGVVGAAINADFLTGAGSVASIDSCSVSLNPLSRDAPNFVRALLRGQIKMLDNT